MYVQLLSLVISTQECTSRVLLSSTRDTEANGALLALRCAESSKFRKFLPAEPISLMNPNGATMPRAMSVGCPRTA